MSGSHRAPGSGLDRKTPAIIRHVSSKEIPQTGISTYKVQSNDIIVPLSGIEFDCHTARIAARVGELPAKGDRREAHKNGGFDAGALQKVRLIDTLDYLRQLEVV